MRRHRRGRPPEPQAFVAIEKWMEQLGATYADMARWCGVNESTLRHGLRTGKVKKDVIDAILRVTGMKYEVAFRQGR